jgi:lipid-binding SYLF domain-containing protein
VHCLNEHIFEPRGYKSFKFSILLKFNLTFKEADMSKFQRLIMLLFIPFAIFSLLVVKAYAADSREDLDKQATQALQTLIKNNPIAADFSKMSKATLVFPKIVKAGLVFGGSYGEGVLIKDGSIADYYRSTGLSWGLQAGAQSYGYVLFLMNDKAIEYLQKSKGWEVGVGPSVVVMSEGVAKNVSTTTLKDDAYAFIFDQQGLMASLSIEGNKISRIKR